MLVSLKQTEIIAALKQYIASQGINLTDKIVDMAFTAGRRESGISVEISIEERNGVPNLPDRVANGDADEGQDVAQDTASLKTTLSLVGSEAAAQHVTEPEEPKDLPVAEAEAAPEGVSDTPSESAPADEPKVKTHSLFS
jgi:hypothetical protein